MRVATGGVASRVDATGHAVIARPLSWAVHGLAICTAPMNVRLRRPEIGATLSASFGTNTAARGSPWRPGQVAIQVASGGADANIRRSDRHDAAGRCQIDDGVIFSLFMYINNSLIYMGLS
jgi:hypothetical protein